MFFISDLKSRARLAFKKNYGTVVLVALIFSFINGSLVTSSSNPGAKKGVESLTPATPIAEDNFIDFAPHENAISELLTSYDPTGLFRNVTDTVLMILAVIMAFSFLLNIFLFNPLKVGCTRFFLQNAGGYPGLKELGYAFKNNYFGIVKAMFIRDVFLLLWSLLFIIPGIIKGYSYKMVPYLLAENPNLSAHEAITLSREMMTGYKMTGFFIDLSFIGWIFLATLTFGFSGVLYSNPYYFATNTEFYLELKKLNSPNQYFDTNENFNPYL